MKKWYSLFFVFSAYAFPMQAQDYIDLIKLYYANTPLNQFDNATQGSRVKEWGLDLTLPVRLNDQTALLTGLFFEKISTKASPASSINPVYTVNPRLGVNLKHGERWSGTYLLLPKLSSDLNNFSGKDFQMGALVLLKYIRQENLNYKMGLYYNSELFGPFFVPILGLYYKSPNHKFETDLSLPLAADMNYSLLPWLKAGVNFSAFVRSYYLNEPQLSENEEYLVKRTSEIFTYLQFNLQKSIILQTKVGYAIGRSYRIYDENDQMAWGLSAFRFGDNTEQLNPDFKDGAIFSVRILYRFYMNE